MKKIAGFGLPLIFFFAACENRAGNQVTPPPGNYNTTPTQTQTNQANTVPVQNNTVPVKNSGSQNLIANPGQSGASVKLNPAHGQPGHRCDIPVGSPLNSPAGGQVVPQQQQPASVSPMMAQPVLNQPAAGAKLNPPHGQPGHDCTIPVGQPLRS